LNLGTSLSLIGSKFRGLSEGSGGNSSQNSPGDCPVVQLRSLDNGRVLFLSSAAWQTTSYVSLPVTNFPVGYAMATVFANGIPSPSAIFLVAPAPTTIRLTNTRRLGNGSLQFSFTNMPGARFTAQATADLSSGNWTALGGPVEIGSGQFQFTDSQATNHSQRFYRVTSP
jgi:hypothetical protein